MRILGVLVVLVLGWRVSDADKYFILRPLGVLSESYSGGDTAIWR